MEITAAARTTAADIAVTNYTYSASHASYYPGASMMSVKVLWDKATQKILGAQIVGFDGVDKRMNVHCHSGLRSYIACRILAGFGFECYNLAGGWRIYESVINERTVPEYVCTECK